MDILVSPQIERLIRDSLDEDIGAGDLATMATISAECPRHRDYFAPRKPAWWPAWFCWTGFFISSIPK